MKLSFQRRRVIGMGLTLLAVVAGYAIYNYFHRPLFFNTFGFGRDALVPSWRISPPLFDDVGKMLLRDERLGIFVLVENARVPGANSAYKLGPFSTNAASITVGERTYLFSTLNSRQYIIINDIETPITIPLNADQCYKIVNICRSVDDDAGHHTADFHSALPLRAQK